MHVDYALDKALDRYDRSSSQKIVREPLHPNDRHPEKRHFLDKDQFINESGLLV